MRSVEKTRGLLKRLFRTENADLDFGIYRIMNFKRAEIERFIDKDLIEAAEVEFKEFAKVGATELEKELYKRKKEINDFVPGTIGEDWGVLKSHDLPKVKEFIGVLDEYLAASVSEEQVQDVFNHVYEFFSRYYEKGDFIPRTRYGGRDKYFVPYHGEEVLLHWATKDMYYVKTGEYFNKYSFRAGRFRITFKLVEVQIEQGNVKGDRKFFILHGEEPVVLDEDYSELEIRFNYRPLTDEEKEKYSKRKTQDDLIDDALTKIGASLGVSSISGILRPRSGEEKSLMRKHLEAYVERNTKDFFIHKDLKGFLSKEFEFYLKNEVWDLNVLENSSESQTKLMTAKSKAIRGISTRIIEFLAQIEEFQKKLFEKKKFVLRTDYCITFDLIPEEFYEEIGKNKEQVMEWKKLYKLDEVTSGTLYDTYEKDVLNLKFRKQFNNLVVDTKHFSDEFKSNILSSFPDFDDSIMGMLYKSDNIHALKLISNKSKDRIKTIYIDPPYNTQKQNFPYKDNYRHSSWLSMIYDRVQASKEMLNKEGVFWSSIDDNEFSRFMILLQNEIFSENNYLGEVVWKTTTDNNPSQIALEHEYVLCFAKDKSMQGNWSVDSEKADIIRNKYNELKKKFNSDINKIQDELRVWMKKNDDKLEGVMHYNYVDKKGVYNPQNAANPHPGGYIFDVIHPFTKRKCKIPANGFRWPERTFKKLLENGDIYFGTDETTIPKPKKRLKVSKDFLRSVYYEDNRSSIKYLDNLFGERVYDTVKSINLLQRLFDFSTGYFDIILDSFAGSGSTADAVIRLNKKDSGERKFILIEMADYFDTIIIPRIKKVIYSYEWKNGRPDSNNDQSLLMKYQHIEQYEDALNNIEFKQTGSSIQTRLDRMPDYFLTYMLDYETKDSPTRISFEQFKTPFNYRIKTISGGEEREEPVDLVETFNYLLGLHINRLRAFKDGDRFYKVVYGTRGNEQVVVIWRDTPDLDLKRDKEFIENTVLSEITPDTVYINGDSHLKNAKPIEPEFKRLMGA